MKTDWARYGGIKMKSGMGGVSRRTVLRGAGATAGIAVGSGAIRGFRPSGRRTSRTSCCANRPAGHRHSRASPSRRPRTSASPCRCRPSRTRTCSTASCRSRARIDCADVSIVFLRYLIGRNILQAIPVTKVKYWDKTIPLFTKGEYPDGRKASQQGITPYTVLYATGAGRAEGSPAEPTRMADRRADRHQRRHARHPSRSGRAGRSRAGPTC